MKLLFVFSILSLVSFSGLGNKAQANSDHRDGERLFACFSQARSPSEVFSFYLPNKVVVTNYEGIVGRFTSEIDFEELDLNNLDAKSFKISNDSKSLLLTFKQQKFSDDFTSLTVTYPNNDYYELETCQTNRGETI